MTLPLAGRRIVVTRSRAQAGPLSRLLRDAGAEVLEVPLIDFEFGDDEDLARELDALANYELLVFTSANAVRAVSAVPGAAAALSRPSRPRVVAVGKATAATLGESGIGADIVAADAGSVGVMDALRGEELAGVRVLFPRAAAGREELAEWLLGRGAEVTLVDAYRTVAAAEAVPELEAALGAGVDMLTFASPSAVEGFTAATSGRWARPAGLAVACIGPTTAAAATALGLAPDVVATDHTAEGLLGVIVDHYSMPLNQSEAGDVVP